jgi:hypothetical protein
MDRICACKESKTYQLRYDGGSFGEYSILVCKACHSEIDREFLITEVKLSESL